MKYEIINDEIVKKGAVNEHRFHKKGELTIDEYEAFLAQFELAEEFGELREIVHIAKDNGEELLSYLESSSLKRHYRVTHQTKMIREANRRALNFATSIKTFLDISERIVRSRRGAEGLKLYKDY